MPNRISQRLWPVEYWQNKKRQFMAGSSSRNIWMAAGLGVLALIFAFTVTAGVITSRPYEQAKQIPLRPMPEDRLLPAKLLEEPLTANMPVSIRKQEVEVKPVSPSIWPTAGALIHDFGWQEHPVLKDWRYHAGVDLAAETGQPVVAAISGTVREVRQDAKTGLTVVITSRPWAIYHGSLSLSSVKTGDAVTAGQIIGQAGTAFQEPYPHIHLAIEKNGQYVNPAEVLPSR